jgi:hypothetical protein
LPVQADGPASLNGRTGGPWDANDDVGLAITFELAENPSFTNKTATKTIRTHCDNPHMKGRGVESCEMEGGIDWKEGKEGSWGGGGGASEAWCSLWAKSPLWAKSLM